MTFDFFNPSHLAFGSKLTKAFNQLNRVCLDAEDALVDLQRVYEVYTQYVNRNYPCPVPNRPDAPCRTNELFDLINDVQTIKELRLDDEGVLHCALNIFKRNTNRITVASGSTELKEGYVFYTSSVSNQNYTRELQFVEDYSEGKGNFVFEYRIDEDNNINIVGDSSNYFYPGDFDHICGMEYANDIIFEDGKYTAEDEECIVCVGHGGSGDADRKLQVKINDTVKFYVNAKNQKNFCVVYLKPDDVLSGDMTRAFKVKYLANEVPIPEPVEPGFIANIIDVNTGNPVDSSIINALNRGQEATVQGNGEITWNIILRDDVQAGNLVKIKGKSNVANTMFVQSYIALGENVGDSTIAHINNTDQFYELNWEMLNTTNELFFQGWCRGNYSPYTDYDFTLQIKDLEV